MVFGRHPKWICGDIRAKFGMKSRFFAIVFKSLIAAVLCTGCIDPRPNYGAMSDAEIRGEVAWTPYRPLPPGLQKEIMDRHIVPEAELPAVLSGELQIGMRENLVQYIWGQPNSTNVTTTKFGVHKQLVYNSHRGKLSFVYIENGVVTAIQN